MTPILRTGCKSGRPTLYSCEVAVRICRRIAEGEPLTRICKDEHMPGYSTVLLWRSSNREFAALYAKAREDQADVYADQILDIADQAVRREVDVHCARLAIDARKWVASKLKPRAYGDRVGVEYSGALTATVTRPLERAPEWLKERIGRIDSFGTSG